MDGLEPQINSGDKEPGYDGSIFLSSTEKFSKTNAKRIDVQVKGTTQRVTSRVRKSINIKDLKMYRDNGGCLYFVVWIDCENKSKRITYISITPRIAERLIKQNSNKRSIMVKLKDFPMDNKEIIDLLNDFHYTSMNQASYIGKKLPTFRDVVKANNSVELFVGKDNISSIFPIRSGFEYVSDNIDNLFISQDGMMIPIETSDIELRHISQKEEILHQYKGQKIKITKVIETDKEKTYQTINDCICFSFDSNSEGKHSVELEFKIKFADLLSIRIQQLLFLLEIDDPTNMLDPRLGIKLTEKSHILENWELKQSNFQSQLSFLERVQSIFEKLGVNDDLNLKSIDEEGYKNLSLLLAWDEKRPVKISNYSFPFLLLTIGNITLVMFIDFIKEDEIQLYDIREDFENLVTPQLAFSIDPERVSKSTRTSKYAILLSTDISKISNLNMDEIIDDFSKYSEGVIPNVIYMLDELLKAFDKTRNTNFLDDAEKLYRWLLNNDYHEDTDFDVIYKYQIDLRRGKTENKDLNSIFRIVYNSEIIIYKAMGFLLVLDFDSYERLIPKLSTDERDYVLNSAAYSYFKHTKQCN